MNEVKDTPAVTIRQPATANLLLDSADRTLANFPLANNFSINKPQALLNGFFHRVGTTEIVLEWFTPNISPTNANNQIRIDLSGGTGVTGTYTSGLINLNGFYTQGDLVDLITEYLNIGGAILTPNVSFTIQNQDGVVAIIPDNNVYIQLTGSLAVLLGFAPGYQPFSELFGVPFPDRDLRSIRYLDFISPQLTYNQDLKDASTARIVRDVLARWYMAWDNPPQLDQHGFPILMGYQAFVCRRMFSPPKQIRWDNIQPIGNISFEVYDNTQNLARINGSTNWLMTLQVSEN